MNKEQALYLLNALNIAVNNRKANLNTGEARTELNRALAYLERYIRDSDTINYDNPNDKTSKLFHWKATYVLFICKATLQFNGYILNNFNSIGYIVMKHWNKKHWQGNNPYIQLPKIMVGTLMSCKKTGKLFRVTNRHIDRVTLTAIEPTDHTNQYNYLGISVDCYIVSYYPSLPPIHVSEVMKDFSIVNKKMYKALYG